MAELSSFKPRSLNSNGVAGLLKEECDVLYSNVFSAKSVGRVSDLIAARLEDQIKDSEVHVRAAILFTLMEGLLQQSGKRKPVSLECGIDDAHLVICASFEADATAIKEAGSIERIHNTQPSNAFEFAMTGLLAVCHHVILRTQAAENRVELIGVLALPGVITAEEIHALDRKIQIVDLAEKPEESPKTRSYTELGDLDYAKLLKDDGGIKDSAAPKTGAFLVKDNQDWKAELRRIKAVTDKNNTEKTVVKGDEKQDKESNQIVSGEDSNNPGAYGSSSNQNSNKKTDLRLIKNSIADAPEKLEPNEKIEFYKKQIQALRDRLNEYIVQAETAPTLVAGKAQSPDSSGISSSATPSGESSTEETTQPKTIGKKVLNSIRGFFKRAFNEDTAEGATTEKVVTKKEAAANARKTKFKLADIRAIAESAGKTESENSAIPIPLATPQTEALAAETQPTETQLKKQEAEKALAAENPDTAKTPESVEAKKEKNPEEDSEEAASAESADAELTSNKLINEINGGGLDKIVAQTKEQLEKAKKDPVQAKKIIDNMMGEVMSEKSRLLELAKKLNLSIRQKELTFKNQEQTYQAELRRSSEALKQKESALTHMKGQAAQTSAMIEQLKSANQVNAEDLQFKHKYAQQQKVVASLKEENIAVQAKFDELKSQHNSLKLNAGAKQNSLETQDLNTKLERAQKQADEYRKQYQFAMEKLREKKPTENQGVNTEEMKRRYDAALKMASQSKKEAETMRTKFDEMKRDEVRQRLELAKVQEENRRNSEELKKLRDTRIRPGSGNKPGGAAPAAPAAGKKPNAA